MQAFKTPKERAVENGHEDVASFLRNAAASEAFIEHYGIYQYRY
jgi:hypothetical protein